MFSAVLILSLLLLSKAFPIHKINRKPLKLFQEKSDHNIKHAINIFNIIDIIQPNSLSRIVQYILFFFNAYKIIVDRFKEEFLEKNIHFSIDIIPLSFIFIYGYWYYINNQSQMKKMDNLLKTNNTEKCISIFEITILFTSYFLFKDVLSAS